MQVKELLWKRWYVIASIVAVPLVMWFFASSPEEEKSKYSLSTSHALPKEEIVFFDQRISTRDSLKIWLEAGIRKGHYAGVDPALLVVTPNDFKGHPAFARARFLTACRDFMSSANDISEGLNAAEQLDASGHLVDYVNLVVDAMTLQCKDVSSSDLKSIDALIQEAAAAGDVGARSNILLKSAQVALDSVNRISDADSSFVPGPATPETMNLVAQAKDLALAGDRQAMFTISKLMMTDRLGVQDVAISAAWLVVAMQRDPSGVFDASTFDYSFEPYSDLSASQRREVIKLAENYHRSCCVGRSVD